MENLINKTLLFSTVFCFSFILSSTEKLAAQCGLNEVPAVITSTVTGNADVATVTTGVTNPNNALGESGSTYAELDDNSDVLVLDLTDQVLSGGMMTITLSESNHSVSLFGTASDPTIEIQSSTDGTTFGNPVTTVIDGGSGGLLGLGGGAVEITDFDYPIPAGGVRYLRFVRTAGQGYPRVFKVSYSFDQPLTICLTDTDGDGVADSEDIDDDNDGIIDSVEGSQSSGSSATFVDDADTNFDITGVSDAQMAINTLFGADVSALTSNISLVAGGTDLSTSQVGFATDLDQITNSGGATGAFSDFSTGIVLGSGPLNVLDLNNNLANAGSGGQGAKDADFGPNEFDVASLSFDIMLEQPALITGRYIFSSEEYNEYVGSNFNDAAKVFINGSNVALAADGSVLSINAVNSGSNASQYVDNTSGAINFETDGFTTTMTFTTALLAGTNSVKIGVADIADANYGSWFFFESGSFNLSTLSLTRTDTDGDSIFDDVDLDSDNDGISDMTESGYGNLAYDTNNDGTISVAEAEVVLGSGNADPDGDGLLNVFTATTGTAPLDSETTPDGIFDFIDLDSDDDNIPDATEARASDAYVAYTGSGDAADSDDDGILDIYDSSTAAFGFATSESNPAFVAGTILANADADDTADSVPDYLDTDSDGDGILDDIEAGTISVPPTYADPDGSVNDPLAPASDLSNVDLDTSDTDFRSLDQPECNAGYAIPILMKN